MGNETLARNLAQPFIGRMQHFLYDGPVIACNTFSWNNVNIKRHSLNLIVKPKCFSHPSLKAIPVNRIALIFRDADPETA